MSRCWKIFARGMRNKIVVCSIFLRLRGRLALELIFQRCVFEARITCTIYSQTQTSRELTQSNLVVPNKSLLDHGRNVFLEC